jgi:hypothetical protein
VAAIVPLPKSTVPCFELPNSAKMSDSPNTITAFVTGSAVSQHTGTMPPVLKPVPVMPGPENAIVVWL